MLKWSPLLMVGLARRTSPLARCCHRTSTTAPSKRGGAPAPPYAHDPMATDDPRAPRCCTPPPPHPALCCNPIVPRLAGRSATREVRRAVEEDKKREGEKGKISKAYDVWDPHGWWRYWRLAFGSLLWGDHQIYKINYYK